MRIVFAIGLLLLSAFPGLLYGESSLPRLLATLELDRQEAFVKEQILVTLRLGYPKEAFGMSPSTLQVSNADLYPLDKTEWEESVDNLAYRMIETKYAMFGNTVGNVSLSAAISSALLPVSAGGSDSTENPKIQASLEPLIIHIKPVPNAPGTDSSNQWLAASAVSMSADWENISDALQPGTPITRRIVIKVRGQHAAAVPQQLDLNLPDGVRAYPAQAISSTDNTPEGLSGSVILPVTLVASEGGDIDLPEVTLPWWDINEHQWRYATLPLDKITVVPMDSSVVNNLYKRISVVLGVLVGVLGVCCVALWRRSAKPYVQKATQETSERQAWKRLQKSFKHHDNSELRNVMLAWGRELYPDENKCGLEHLSLKHPEVREMVSALDQDLYGKQPLPDVDRKQLMRALAEVRQEALRVKKKRRSERSLYPESIS